jgi:DNA-binding CsgD family transcriptional regulator
VATVKDRGAAVSGYLHERGDLLARLASFERDARRGQSRLILVRGEAGVGKTSLVEAFAAQVAERAGAGSVHLGTCEATEPSPPFAPLSAIADAVGGPLAHALAAENRTAVIDSFLTLLQRPSRARVVVLENLHWADAATLDLLRTVGRRFRETRSLVIGTYRDDEVDATHPLRLAVDDIPSPAVVELGVSRLSRDAVRAMARGTGIDWQALYRATAGNAFFVTELIASFRVELPTSVRAAVLARAARLSDEARHALRAASVLGSRWEPELLREVAGCVDQAVRECVARGMLEQDPESGLLRFRHDLAQGAIGATLSDTEGGLLHARALAVLVSWADTAAVEPARLARHAVGAADADAVLRLAPIAAGRASELGAHREAATHYAAALGASTSLDPSRRAELLEAHARESRLADWIDDALRSQTAAVDAWRGIGDRRREGDALHVLSELHWFAGRPARARELADEAVALLKSIAPHGVALARAYAAVAQRCANAGKDDDRGLQAAQQAIRLAEAVGDERVALHASTSRAVIETYRSPDAGLPLLEAVADRAAAANLREEEARALINLVEAGRDLRRYAVVDRYRNRALACVEDHHLDILRRRLLSDLADLSLARGRWGEAAALGESVAAERTTAAVIRAKALVVLGQLRARRGDGDPWPLLDEALELVGRAGEGQDLSPVRVARAEAAWLDGDLVRASEEAASGMAETAAFDDGWWLGEIAWWRHQTDMAFRPPLGLPQPYALEFDGRHHEAAACWQAIGAPYHRARSLAGSSDEGDLRQALELLRALGAHRCADRVRDRLRQLGARRVPRGPRRSTQRNPEGLTNRQFEVLGLLREGLTNAEIAERLVVSPKTVDHHVSAVLRKLRVRRRAAAARRADLLASADLEK